MVQVVLEAAEEDAQEAAGVVAVLRTSQAGDVPTTMAASKITTQAGMTNAILTTKIVWNRAESTKSFPRSSGLS